MKRHSTRLWALMAWGALVALHAGHAHAQHGGSSSGSYNFSGNTTPGASNLYAPPTGGPINRASEGAVDNLPGNLGQPGLGGNTVKTLAGNGPHGAPNGAPNGPAGGGPAGGAPNVGGAAGGVPGAAGGTEVAVAGVASGLSTVNPTSILGNGMPHFNGGFPFGHHGHPNGGNRSNQTNCSHVINILMRHCMGNRLFEGQKHGAVGGGFFPGHMGQPPFFGGHTPGDLELLGVNVIAEAGPNAGPMYQVSLKNNSQIAVQNFRISLVAVLGVIDPFSPNVTITVPQVAAGEITNVQVQLPANVMAMGVPTQPLVPFDTLVVAIDSFDELIESNEFNNVATLKRVGIPLMVVTSTGGAAGIAAPSGPAPSGPSGPAAIAAPATPANPGVQVAPGNPGTPANPAPTPSILEEAPAQAPMDNGAPRPNDKINLDNIDLGESGAAATQVGQ